MRRRKIEDVLADEKESLRRTVRSSLNSLTLPVLQALLRIIRYAEEGKTPMAVAAEDLSVPYKVEIIFNTARDMCRLRAARPRDEEAKSDES